MPRPIHALCLAGGEAPSRGHWIAHYRALGIELVHVYSWYEAKHRAFNEFRAVFPED